MSTTADLESEMKSWEDAWARDEPKRRYQEALTENLNECLVRFGGLHSWYKRRGCPDKVLLYPVMGGVQEPQKGISDGIKPVQEKEIYWHILPASHLDYLDFVDCHDDIKAIVESHPVYIADGSGMYLSTSHRLHNFGRNLKGADLSDGKRVSNLHKNVFDMCVEFANYFSHFKPFYDECMKQAKLIMADLVKVPTLPLPRGVTKTHYASEADMAIISQIFKK